MPARTIAESIKFREWVDGALRDGKTYPSQILEWIEQHKEKDEPSPSLPTISKILDEKGYKPTGRRWEKKGK